MTRLLDIIFDLVLLATAAKVLAAAFRGIFGSGRIHFSHSASPPRPEAQRRTMQGETVRDPVCGMFVSTELAHRLEWHEQVHHFCSEECLERYRRNASS